MNRADTVTKTMSLSEAEIHRSLVHMQPGLVLSTAQKHISITHAGMEIGIHMTPMDPLRPTPLMVLPRHRIDITFPAAMTAKEKTAFIHRFDNTFRRGGG